MAEQSYDGHPLQAGTSRRDHALTGEHAHYSIAGLREMVVVARYFADQVGNRSRRYVEYTCRDIYSGELYPNARFLSPMGGMANGEENVLHPSTMSIPGSTSSVQFDPLRSPARSVDGDQVLVGFIDGSKSRPVILGVFVQNSAAYGATSDDGERRYLQQNGTTVEIKDDGTYVITGIGEVDVTAANVVELDAPNVKLGVNAVQPVIRGTDFNDNVLAPMNDAYLTLSSTAAAAIVTMNAAPGPPATVPVAVEAIASALETFSTSMEAAIAQFGTTISTKVHSE